MAEDSGGPKRVPMVFDGVATEFAPWLKMIVALELLATLVALKIWVKREVGGARNDFILRRGLSTKCPFTVPLIEVSEVLRESNSFAASRWVRRDENRLADDLTNEKFDKFKEENRIPVSRMVGQEMYENIRFLKDKEEKRRGKAAAPKGKSTVKFFKRWDS